MGSKEVVKNKQNEKSKKRIKTRVWLVILSLIFFIVLAYISFRGSYLETLGIGKDYLSVLRKKQTYKYGIMAIIFGIVYLSVYITNMAIKKGLKSIFKDEGMEMPKLPNKTIALIAGILFCMILSDGFIEKTMLFFNSAWFGFDDPIFSKDIGFYMFKLPFMQTIVMYFIALVSILTVYIAIYYIIVINISFNGVNGESVKKSLLIKHISFNLIVIAFAVAIYFLLKTQGMLTDKFLTINDNNSTRLVGAGAIDIIIKKWGNIILAPIIVVTVFWATKAFKKQNTKKVVGYLCVVPAYLMIMFISMIIYKLAFINSNELDKQEGYIKCNIESTQKAYNIDLDVKNLEDGGTIDITDVANDEGIINNIPIIDKETMLKNLNISQTSVGYYSYEDTNLASYEIDGKTNLVYISPREILNNDSVAYNNKTYEYTHGYGAVVTSATKVDEFGTVKYIQNDFNSKSDKIVIKQPRIYFGLKTNSTIVTNTNNKVEFDYPTDSVQNVEYSYEGKAGLKLGLVDRIILGLHEKNPNLAFSSNVNADSKIITTRNVRERAKKIMPYLLYDENPYLVVDDTGKLVWVIDAYTTSNEYPYSQSTTFKYENFTKEINYIRNSVKVLVDAYDGTVTFYITDKTDPIAMAYNNIFKGLFEDGSAIPKDISKHFVYPEFLYNIQADIINQYHDVSADVLYRGNDVWARATYSKNINVTNKGIEFEPYYSMVKKSDTKETTLGLILPYTQSNKQNIRAYLVGTTEGDDYQKLTLYKYAENSNILGTIQLDTQIMEDEVISKEIERISVTGTRLTKSMTVIPINGKLLYVEPIYQQALNDETSAPVLKKVIVASGNKVAIGNNLSEALENLLSHSAGNIKITNSDSEAELILEIIEANNNLKKSTESKDWEMIGKDLEKLQKSIDRLEKLKKEQNSNQNKSEGIIQRIFE